MNKLCLTKKSVLLTKLATAVVFICALMLAAGCASKPKEGNAQTKATGMESGMTKEEILNHEDVKGKTPTMFQHPLEKTREAALRALTFVGCEVKKHQMYYVSGRRPNKMGLFVGSGGETVEVFLHPRSETETEVWVDTDMSFGGIAGQQGWNDQVIQEMTSILAKPAPTP